MVLFLVCEENHTGDNTRFLGLFSWLCGNWSSRPILSFLACIFPPGFLEEFLGFKAQVSNLSVPMFRWYLLALQLFSQSNAELMWNTTAVWPWARSVRPYKLCVPQHCHLVISSMASVLTSPWLCRWSFACPAASGGGMHGFVWIHLSMACASCVLHFSTRAL